MQILDKTTRLVTDTAYTATSATGAVGGALVGGIVGSLRGAAEGAVDGVRSGARSGTDSTPAAALTIAALGLTGLVAWPVLVAVGGGALAVRLLTPRPEAETAITPLRATGPRAVPQAATKS
ncbi:MAG: hypothetical protein WAW17_12410 [Rhodococcus sp. (in: high G+C Gram-positive bacteria)]|uniref:hypothetical protein n=1 Tax=Rhodococcus sp. TaxID=1831 RepID=UPI003BAE36E7